MKQTIYFLWVTLCAVILTGCATQQKGSTTSFYEVDKKLDKGGEFYLYVNTEDVLKKLDTKTASFEKLILTVPSIEDNKADIKKAFTITKNIIKNSGIKELDGIGSSSIKINDNMYRNIAYFYHKPENNKGVFWSFFPVQEKTQRMLTLLPKDTVIASGSNFQFNKFLNWIESELTVGDLADISKNIREGKIEALKRGVDIDKILNSLNGEYAFFITLDPKKKSKLPMGRAMVEMPRPAVAILIEVSDEYVFSLLKQFIPMSKASVRENGVQEINVLVPQFLDIDLTPTMLLTKTGLLIIATSKTLANDVLALDGKKEDKPKGLIATENFKKLATNISLDGNGFSYVSKRYNKTATSIQKQMLDSQNDESSTFTKKIMDKINQLYSNREAFAVVRNTNTGIVIIANAPVSQKVVLAAAPMGITAVAAGMLLPALNSAREKAHRIACISNLKQIGLGIIQYSMDFDDKFPPRNWVETLVKQEYLTDLKMYSCPSGTKKCDGTSATSAYNYFGDLFSEANSADTPLVIDKIGNHKRYVNILFIDGHAAGFRGDFTSMTQVINMLSTRYKYSKEELRKLQERAKEIDAQ
jgi:prepilin-type processing-associated H-X9-DG protein